MAPHFFSARELNRVRAFRGEWPENARQFSELGCVIAMVVALGLTVREMLL